MKLTWRAGVLILIGAIYLFDKGDACNDAGGSMNYVSRECSK